MLSLLPTNFLFLVIHFAPVLVSAHHFFCWRIWFIKIFRHCEVWVFGWLSISQFLWHKIVRRLLAICHLLLSQPCYLHLIGAVSLTNFLYIIDCGKFPNYFTAMSKENAVFWLLKDQLFYVGFHWLFIDLLLSKIYGLDQSEDVQLLVFLGSRSDEINDVLCDVSLNFLIKTGRSCALKTKRLIKDDL